LEQLKHIRKERGLSQAKLAARAGIDPSTVNQIETGARKPTTATLEKLAEALDIELADLFRGYALPKAQKPLWSDEPERERLYFNFREAREQLEEYCRRWEQRISKNGLDDRAIEDFMSAGQGFIPVLDIALRAELHELRRVDGLEGSELLQHSEIAQANDRYLAVFSEIAQALGSLVEAAGASAAPDNVVRIEEAQKTRKRLADLPAQAVG
jgi:transcriptional regulator with XRE-family HTH domain